MEKRNREARDLIDDLSTRDLLIALARTQAGLRKRIEELEKKSEQLAWHTQNIEFGMCHCTKDLRAIERRTGTAELRILERQVECAQENLREAERRFNHGGKAE